MMLLAQSALISETSTAEHEHQCFIVKSTTLAVREIIKQRDDSLHFVQYALAMFCVIWNSSLVAHRLTGCVMRLLSQWINRSLASIEPSRPQYEVNETWWKSRHAPELKWDYNKAKKGFAVRSIRQSRTFSMYTRIQTLQCFIDVVLALKRNISYKFSKFECMIASDPCSVYACGRSSDICCTLRLMQF